MTSSTVAPERHDSFAGMRPSCRIFPLTEPLRALIADLLGNMLQLTTEDDPAPREPILVDCLRSHDEIAAARSVYPEQPLISVLPRHDPELIIAALAHGAAGVVALTDEPAQWVACVRVVMGGGRWLGGPGLEISLEENHAAYDVASSDELKGNVTMRTRLFVKQRVADKLRS
jgi:DNA-binding NarL/FixJ family response regulator